MTKTPQDLIIDFMADCGVTEPMLGDAIMRAEAPAVASQSKKIGDPQPRASRGDRAASNRPNQAAMSAMSPMPAMPAVPPDVAPDDDGEDDSIMAARELARDAPDLATLHRMVAAFDGCPLKLGATRAVLGAGPIGAPLLLVGEAPGRDEDREGIPFVGRSGQLLTKMLAAIGLAREAVYVTNVLPWRPPANRTPTPAEAATCEVFLRREIALVRPQLVVALGRPAMKTLFGVDASIMRERGRWRTYADPSSDLTIEGIATFHPAYLLRTPVEKRRAWADLLSVKGRLDRMAGQG